MRVTETTAQGTELVIGARYEILGMHGMKYHGTTGSGQHCFEHPAGRVELYADPWLCELVGRGEISLEEEP